jgi:predicted  nucleic acid-binding Zn-ribbon protein
MKKETKNITVKKEKVTLETLARMMARGFETMVTKEEFDRRVSSLEQGQNSLKQGQAKLEQGQVRLEQGQEETRQEIAAVKEEQKDTNRRVISIERKLSGTQISLDETVHRREFNKLEHRVEALES